MSKHTKKNRSVNILLDAVKNLQKFKIHEGKAINS